MASSSETNWPSGRQPCRLIVDEPADGAWNMALDEALLEAAATRGVWSLRFYGWSTPTLSLGYFQRWEDRQQHPASLGCPWVRRSSGGGAIMHDAELTYSLAVAAPPNRPLAAATLYRQVHRALVETLQELAGISAILHECAPHTPPSGPEPFMCFQRRAEGDVLIGAVKIAGSAQRRLRGAVLQHGSVLLHTSSSAPELAGISALTTTAFSSVDLQANWAARLSDALDLELTAAHEIQTERQRAADLIRDKYSHEGWNRRR